MLNKSLMMLAMLEKCFTEDPKKYSNVDSSNPSSNLFWSYFVLS